MRLAVRSVKLKAKCCLSKEPQQPRCVLALMESVGIGRRCPPRTSIAWPERQPRLNSVKSAGKIMDIWSSFAQTTQAKAPRMESRICGNLRPPLIQGVFDEVRNVPIISFEKELALSPNLVFDVLDYHAGKTSIVWQCLNEWLEVRKPDTRIRYRIFTQTRVEFRECGASRKDSRPNRTRAV